MTTSLADDQVLTPSSTEHETQPPTEPTPQLASFARMLLLWLREGARTCIFKAPRWDGLDTSAIFIAILMAAGILETILLQRLYITGPATFYWRAATSGWINTAVFVWVCYLLRSQSGSAAHAATAPSAAHLFTMMMAQSLIIIASLSILLTPTIYSGISTKITWIAWIIWGAWIVAALWGLVAHLMLLWRGSDRKRWPMAIAILAVVGAATLTMTANPLKFWYPQKQKNTAADYKRLELTQEVMEAQPKLLTKRLDEIKPLLSKNGSMYIITFAPYDSDVFRRESDVVAKVMAERYHAQGRVLQLVNNVDTLQTWPWATPLNLQRAIRRYAQVMDHDKDILFLHLTSHGGADAELATSFWPMEVEMLNPKELKAWLDAAGIRNRVISISACFSGSWIAPLADANTLVLTAADADHTSYGCGSKSELTFFGRAMYDEQMRNPAVSFEQAYQTARQVIQKREQEAGKEDGFSNPQIRMGANIRSRLAALQNAHPAKTGR